VLKVLKEDKVLKVHKEEQVTLALKELHQQELKVL
jgi:hypothetical protein